MIETEEFELDDIFETYTFKTIDAGVEKNIEYVLKREKLLPKGARISIPAIGGLDWETEGDLAAYNANFYITGGPLREEIIGQAYGRMLLEETRPDRFPKYTLIDMIVELKTTDVAKLRRLIAEGWSRK